MKKVVLLAVVCLLSCLPLTAQSAKVTRRLVVKSNAVTTGTQHEVDLAWTPSEGGDTFNIYRGTASGAETPLSTGDSASLYTDQNVTSGTTYWYYVTEVSPAGEESKGSNEVQAVIPTQPAPPSGLTVVKVQ
jgi:fibronectin type 3 domain-containing protein